MEKKRRGARPVKEQLGIEHSDYSIAVERAFADFGAEESFGQASLRFEGHYGWSTDRATMRRKVEKTAQLAQQYVKIRLVEAHLDYSQPLATQLCNKQVLVELDGCHIRTGKKITGPSTVGSTAQQRYRTSVSSFTQCYCSTLPQF